MPHPRVPGADLHAHSTASDGTDRPAELLQAALAARLAVVAITDHDTTGGWAEAAAALPRGLTVVPGAELSCFAPAEDDPSRAVSLHLLAYLFDPEEPRLAQARRRLRDSRVTRAERMVAGLVAAGVPISWEQVRELAGTGAVGRPHVARALVAAGVVPEVGAAFSPELIADGGRFYVDKEELPVLEAIRLVRAAGGVAVFAHPLAARRGEVVGDATIAAMAAAGLAGLEADHVDHDPAARARARGLAADLGLLVTGGSDYHGRAKTVPLGAHTTTAEALEALLAQGQGCRPWSG